MDDAMSERDGIVAELIRQERQLLDGWLLRHMLHAPSIAIQTHRPGETWLSCDCGAQAKIRQEWRGNIVRFTLESRCPDE